MPQYTLTILDTTGIQNYIFGSNRLQENVGASELVKRATEDWVYEALSKHKNIKGAELDNSLHIEDGNLKAEVIYAGGGNALILFADMDEAKEFAAKISTKLIEYAPGINFTIVHTEFAWEKQALGGDKSGVVFDAFAALADAKRSQPVSRPLAGLSVSAFCQSTGLPAVDVDKDGHPISAETKAKLLQKVPAELNDAYDMEIDFNKLSENRQDGKGSYLAVVHADGNNMGQRVESIAKAFPDAGTGNRNYIVAMRKFSQNVRYATERAVAAIELQLCISVPDKYKDMLNGNKIPYRRIIVGGDDVTFVCDGRLALTLTATFLEAFEKEMNALKNPVHAAAGIAVVKTHYPFIRAYKLAEALTGNAKNWIKREREKGQPDFSAMDWHFAPGGLAGNLDSIREREYQLDEKELTLLMRPIALNAGISWRNWENFSHIVECFNSTDKDGWGNKRNKVKAFREALRDGEIGVRQFITAYKGATDEKKVLPEIKTDNPNASVRQSGWGDNKHCAYFDAIEAMDFYLPLKGDSRA